MWLRSWELLKSVSTAGLTSEFCSTPGKRVDNSTLRDSRNLRLVAVIDPVRCVGLVRGANPRCSQGDNVRIAFDQEQAPFSERAVVVRPVCQAVLVQYRFPHVQDSLADAKL